MAEADFFIDALTRRGHHVGAVVLNRTLPHSLLDPGAGAAADVLRDRADELGPALLDGPDGVTAGRVLAEIGASFRDLELVARREAEHRRRFLQGSATVAEVPWFAEDITDLAGLARLGERLREPVDAGEPS